MERIFNLIEKGILGFLFWLEMRKSSKLEKEIAIANEKGLVFAESIKKEKLKTEKKIDKAYQDLIKKLKDRT